LFRHAAKLSQSGKVTNEISSAKNFSTR
jgi:hypothetical protein